MSDCVRKNIKLPRLNYNRMSRSRCSVTCLWFVSRRCHRCILTPWLFANSMEQRILNKLTVVLCGTFSSYCVQNSPLLDPTLSQVHPLHTHTTPNIKFSNSLIFQVGVCCPIRFLMRVTYFAGPIPLDFIFLRVFIAGPNGRAV